MMEKVFTGLAALMLLLVVCVIGYRELATSKVVMEVQLRRGEDPFIALKSVIPPDTNLLEVREVSRERNEYKITVSTRRQRRVLVEWMRRSHRVERIEEVPN